LEQNSSLVCVSMIIHGKRRAATLLTQHHVGY
jgi:hypothetical protein